MKEKPIIFRTDMVQAILEGRKDVTRRIVKDLRIDLERDIWGLDRRTKLGRYPAQMNQHGAVFALLDDGRSIGAKPGEFNFACPYVAKSYTELINGRWHIRPEGHPVLWVRETWTPVDTDEETWVEIAYRSDGKRKKINVDMEAAEKIANMISDLESDGDGGDNWRPSIHMPRWASRLTLEVTDVRIERLQEITEEEALREGVLYYGEESDDYKNYEYNDIYGDDWGVTTARESFRTLWQSINGKRASWESNPFVWRIGFKKQGQQQTT